MPEVTVIASAKAKPGLEEKLEKEFRAVIPPTHEEKGCILYCLHKSTRGKGAYVMVERWASQSDLDQHLKTPHVQVLFKNIADLIQAPPQLMVLESMPIGKKEKEF